MFELQPDLQSYFKFQLREPSLELKLHVRAVIATLDRCVKHLDDWSNVEEDFEQLGMMHAMLNVTKEQLQVRSRLVSFMGMSYYVIVEESDVIFVHENHFLHWQISMKSMAGVIIFALLKSIFKMMSIYLWILLHRMSF